MFELDLPLEQVLAIAASIKIAVSAGLLTRATARRGLGGFEEAWNEYAEHLGRKEV